MAQKPPLPSDKNSEIIKVDLETYFVNTIIPQLFVDADMILRIFTPPAMKQFSLTKADINRNINDVKDNIKHPTIIANIKEVMSTGKILEKEIQTTDGSWYQMNILPYFIKEENKTNGVIITFIDITNRIATLRELEKLNAEHNLLMYTLSHDIRQPLSTMVLLTDVLKKAFDKKDEDKFKKFIDTLRNTAKNMKEIINDFAHDKQDGKPAVPALDERINIENIFEDVLISLRDDIVKNTVDVSTEFHTSEIIFPRNNLRSVVYTLLNRAIKNKDPERDLKITVSTEKEDGFVVLSISDNAKGIPDADIPTIFNNPTGIRQKMEENGMGLHIIKAMVKNRGGDMEMNSANGEGSTFKVYFKTGY